MGSGGALRTGRPEVLRATRDHAAGRRRPVWMINLMKYHDVADYQDGRTSTISGREADDIYAPVGPLAAVGAEIVFLADVDRPAARRRAEVGPGRGREVPDAAARSSRCSSARTSSSCTCTRKRGWSRRSSWAGRSMENPDDSRTRRDWADVPHPSTAEDGPVVVIHVIRFVDGGVDDMTSYQDRGRHGRGAARRAARRLVRRRRHDHRRRAAVGPGALQRVPESGGVHGGRVRPRAARRRSKSTGSPRWPTPTR